MFLHLQIEINTFTADLNKEADCHFVTVVSNIMKLLKINPRNRH